MRIAVLFLLLLATLALAGCGGGEDNSANQSTQPDQPGQSEETTAGGETETEAETDGVETAAGDPSAGADVFASAGCGGCHTFTPAGSTGEVGPNLDETGVDFDEAVQIISNGRDGMPSFGDQLSETEIRNVAAYVVQGPGAGGADDGE
jgi:mono/diheme cytochrome c family protein